MNGDRNMKIFVVPADRDRKGDPDELIGTACLWDKKENPSYFYRKFSFSHNAGRNIVPTRRNRLSFYFRLDTPPALPKILRLRNMPSNFLGCAPGDTVGTAYEWFEKDAKTC